MTQFPGLLILAILAAGALFVLIPVTLTTFDEYRRKKSVICPETGCAAEVGVDAGKAMRSAAFGRLSLRVETCSLWPERKGCDQACLRSSEPVEIQA
jgi:hypothetical protein